MVVVDAFWYLLQVVSTIKFLNGSLVFVQRAQRKALDVLNTVGLSNSVLRLIERRNRVDTWIKYVGMVLTVVIVYFFWKWTRWFAVFLDSLFLLSTEVCFPGSLIMLRRQVAQVLTWTALICRADDKNRWCIYKHSLKRTLIWNMKMWKELEELVRWGIWIRNSGL